MRTLSPLLFAARVVLMMIALSLTPDTASAQPRDYGIGPDDVLDVVVWNNAALSRTVPVRPDGRISLPLLNDITVAVVVLARRGRRFHSLAPPLAQLAEGSAVRSG